MPTPARAWPTVQTKADKPPASIHQFTNRTPLFTPHRGRARRPSEEVGTWRDDVIVPKYVKAVVKKSAWMGEGAAYQQRYFDGRDEAINWLVARG